MKFRYKGANNKGWGVRGGYVSYTLGEALNIRANQQSPDGSLESVEHVTRFTAEKLGELIDLLHKKALLTSEEVITLLDNDKMEEDVRD